MSSKLYFKEEQKFNKPWVAITLLAALIGWIYGIFYVINEPQQENGSASLIILIATAIVPVLFIALYFQVKLVTEVNREGVNYKFYPFQRKFRKLEPGKIEKYYVREYRPIREYGGWGIRTKRLKYGSAYNVSGKTGMQFELKNGEKFLLGTQRGNAFERALDRLFEEKGSP